MIFRRPTLLALAMLAAGCDGPDGPRGPAGEAGAAGPEGPEGSMGAMGAVGAPGPQGPAATTADGGIAGALPVSCLSPCHGFGGVVSQFQTSAHYIAYVTYLGSTTADEWTAQGSPCGNCHAIDALAQRVGGTVLTSDGGVVAHLATGELQYGAPPTQALSSANYAGSASVAEVYCTTCHAVNSANDPHKTGIAWTPGSFPLWVSADAGPVNVEKSPDTTAVTGTNAANYGPGDTCMWCHRSRVDVTNFLSAANAITSVHWGPHEGPQADLFTGVGGYHFKGQTYGQSTHEQKLSCVDCHMMPVAVNSSIPDHSFSPTLAACKSCHAGATTFDVNGFQTQIEDALTEIETWFNAQGFLTRAAAAPYAALTAAQLGDGNWGQDQPVPGATLEGGLLTQDQAGALYDYILVARGGASGVHNPKYIAQLLYDSYNAITGLPLATFPQRPQ